MKRRLNKQELPRWKRVVQSVEDHECGQHAELTLSQCADYVAWIAKFKKLPKSEWGPICDRITDLFEEGF